MRNSLLCGLLGLAILVGCGATQAGHSQVSKPEPIGSACNAGQSEDQRIWAQYAIERAQLSMKSGDKICAWRIIGDVACGLKDLRMANEAYGKVDTSGQDFLIYRCRRNGIERIQGQFKIVEE